MRRTCWLASYPKSGNTWLRLLIANVGRESPLDINSLTAEGGIATAHAPFDHMTMLESGLLTMEERERLRPAVHRALACEADAADDEETPETGLRQVRMVKTHDAWTCNEAGEPVLGGAAAAQGAILIVRDPRDVAASLADHLGIAIDGAIGFMDREDAGLNLGDDRQHRQMRLRLLRWSAFNASWLDQRAIPVHLVRYEDLKADTAGVLRGVLAFAGVDLPPEAAARAAAFTAFDGLAAQERAHGFREAPRPRPGGRFFRRGVAGGWRDELSPGQAERIVAAHRAMMARLGYQVETRAGDEG